MLSKSAVLLALAYGSLAWQWGKSSKWEWTQIIDCHSGQSYINYTTMTGFFQQDDGATDPSDFDYTTTNFGLINRSYPTDESYDVEGTKTQWERFAYYVNTLNAEADKNTQYKVLFMGRHGEGFHNVAETIFSTPAWNCYYSELDGGEIEGYGEVVWADALLTEAGIEQTTKANTFWRSHLADEKIPAPQSYYSSPLSRCLMTANLTFSGLDLPAESPFVLTVKEYFREGISIHTCDRRSNKTHIAATFPFTVFMDGFTEDDELWRATEGETSDAQLARTKVVLDDVFSSDGNTWLSITSHSGEIKTILKALGHREFRLSTGQAIPVLVKAQILRRREVVTTTITSWASEATCNSPPVTSLADSGCVCSSSSTASSATPTVTQA